MKATRPNAVDWSRLSALVFDVLLMATPNLVAFIFFGPIAAALIYGVYVAGMTGSRKQATLGMMVFGLVITDQEGEPITFTRAIVRYVASLLLIPTFGFSYFIAIFTVRHQTLHDLLAATVIARRIRRPPTITDRREDRSERTTNLTQSSGVKK